MRFTTLIAILVVLVGSTAESFGSEPDLMPVMLQVPPSLSDGPNPSLTIVSGVKNMGESANWGWVDGLYISTNSTLDTSTTALASWYVPGPVNSDTTYWTTNNVVLPIGASGDYYIIFKTDVYNGLPESDESNNVMVAPFRFEAIQADLAALTSSVPASVTGPPNPFLDITWTITNRGPGRASGFWVDAVYLSTNSDWTPDAVPLRYTYGTSPLAPGQVYLQFTSVQLPIVQSGNYFLIFKTDIYNSLYEIDTNNNVLSVPIFVKIQTPDLEPVALQVPPSVTSLANPYVTIVWGVTNLGPGEATGFWADQLFISTNSVLEENIDPVAYYGYENWPVPPGGTYWRTNSVRVPVVRSGTYYLFFKADAQNALLESSLDNNTIATPITFVIQQPDLVPISFQAPNIVTSLCAALKIGPKIAV